MHITLETDYAVRIIDTLARSQGRMGAKVISERACVTLRFSLKILRKLVMGNLVRSYKGAQGGYEIARPLIEITLNDILVAIEGPYILSRCLKDSVSCTWTKDKNCPYHYLFKHISEQVALQLQSVTIAQALASEV